MHSAKLLNLLMILLLLVAGNVLADNEISAMPWPPVDSRAGEDHSLR
jgi:hypothetical protein